MKKGKLFLILFTLLFAATTKAQYSNSSVEEQYPNDETAVKVYENAFRRNAEPSTNAVYNTWIANRARDNWFLSVGAGTSVLMSEETRYMDFKDQLSYPSFQFSIGKWFSPVWGIRLNATASKLNGFATWKDGLGLGSWFIGKNYPSSVNNGNPTNTYLHAFTSEGAAEVYRRFLKDGDYITTKEGPGYTYEVEYAGASFDFLLNLKNAFTPYDHKTFFNPVLYGGLGYVHTFGDKDKEITAVNSMMIKGGLQLNFRLHDRWDFFIDGQTLILPEVFDRRVGDGNTQDIVVSVMAGLTYRFNFRHFMKPHFFDQRQIDALNREIEALRNRPEVICPPIPVCPEPVKNEEEVVLTPVFFTLDSYVVRDNQLVSIAKAAQYLINNPNAKIKLAGYADINTGNPKHNMKLSENRSNAVANVLVNRFGIARNRLEITYYGDTVQPFDENDWNRVVIFIVP